jgi:opacity protein-like surface antigen
MMRFATKAFLGAIVLSATVAAAWAQASAPAPWELKHDTGYAYSKDGKLLTYKMGTNNAGLLFKGARKVPKGTLFFIGQNGQLYMRRGPYLESDGTFMFGSD